MIYLFVCLFVCFCQIANNSLIDHIPSELEKLQELRGLQLSSNILTGILPKELGNLSQLESLNVGE